MVLTDNGASVTRIDRPSSTSTDVLCRGKRSIIVDSKLPSGRKLLENLISSADILIDPFRPGVLEKLGLGPKLFLGDGSRKGLNGRLIYARIVGYVNVLPGIGSGLVYPFELLLTSTSFPRTGTSQDLIPVI